MTQTIQKDVSIVSATALSRPIVRDSQRTARPIIHMAQRVARAFSAALAIVLLCAGMAHGQTAGTTIPNLPSQFFTSTGTVCNGCLLYSYIAGSTTALATYSDSALSSANTNPITLSSAGINPAGGIFLSPGSTYKFILKTGAGATIWTRDNISANLSTSGFPSTCDGRITLTSVTPVTTNDVSAATTVYFTPYRGNRCALYDGTQWSVASFSELSLALGTDAANTNYDLFLYSNSGVLTLERVAWSSATARATAITLQDGVYVKSGSTTRRYIGTYRTTGTIGQTEDSLAKRFIWNMQNRVRRPVRVAESTDSWNYTLAVVRQVRATGTNQIAVVSGLGEDPVSLSATAIVFNTNAGVNVATLIGYDSITAGVIGTFVGGYTQSPAANIATSVVCHLEHYTGVGYHYYAWLEYSAATGTTTWSGDGGADTILQAGLTGFVWG